MPDVQPPTTAEPQPRTRVKYRKILCPVDFSPPSQDALEAAADLARSHDAPLTLLHVYSFPLGLPDGYYDPKIFDVIASDAAKALDEWKQRALTAGAPHVDTSSQPGTAAWDAIVTTAREGKFDLIVLGTHGRTGLKHVLLGSVAERVVRHAPCPVLVVRPTAW